MELPRSTRAELVYHFNFSRPDGNFNAIYDDRPLDGGWPGPIMVAAVTQKLWGIQWVGKRMAAEPSLIIG